MSGLDAKLIWELTEWEARALHVLIVQGKTHCVREYGQCTLDSLGKKVQGALATLDAITAPCDTEALH